MGLADPFDDSSHNVKVAVRFRPPDDPNEDSAELYSINGNSVTVQDPLSRGRQTHGFEFSHVFPSDTGQEDVFDVVAKPLVDHLLKGFNSCCFAYGQTGSGKTHSVFGEGSGDQRGMLARSIEYLFEKLEVLSVSKEVGMAVSFTEIYLDQVRDLGRFYAERHGIGRRGTPQGNPSSLPSLPEGAGESASSVPSRPRGSPSARRRTPTGEITDPADAYLNQDLEIHESSHGHVYVEDLSMIPVSNIRDVLEVANLGIKMRATYETKLNARSSRSHTVFTLCIAQRSKLEAAQGGNSNASKIAASSVNFVDLAGSERLARSKSEGRRFQEAVVINTSLSALGKVVLALASNGRCHIPYRDSKLTRILQNSLGGSSYTTLLTTINPSVIDYEESLNSLLFADRCKNVQNRPTLGFVTDDGDDMARRTVATLVEQVTELRKTLEAGSRMMAPRNITPSAHSFSRAQLQAPPELVAGKGPLQDLEGSLPSSDPRLNGVSDTPGPGPPTGSAGNEREATRSKKWGADWLRDRWNSSSSQPGARASGPNGAGTSGSNAKPSRGHGKVEAPANIPTDWRAKDGRELKQLAMLQQAQDRLHHDMSGTAQLEIKAKAVEEGLDSSWSDFYDRDLQRRTKLNDMKKAVKTMETEIASLSSHLRHMEVEIQSVTETKMQAQDQSATNEIKQRERELKSYPAEIREDTKHSVFAAKLEKEAEDHLEKLEKTAEKIWGKCEASWSDCLDWVNKVQQQRCRDEEAEVERLKKELITLKEESEARLLLLQQEMLSVSHLAAQLHQHLSDLRAGVPVDRPRTGVQPPSWVLNHLEASCEGSTEVLEGSLEPLRSALRGLRKQLHGPMSSTTSAAAHNSNNNNSSSNNPKGPLPGATAAAGQNVPNLAQTWPRRPWSGSTISSSGGRPGSAIPHKRPTSGNSTGSYNNNNNGNNDNPATALPDAAGATFVGNGTATSSHIAAACTGPLATANTDSGRADRTSPPEWIAEEMARQFCLQGDEMPGDSAPSALGLQHLGRSRLQALALELWRTLKAGEEAQASEVARLREEVMKELCDESRVKQISDLEKEVTLYQARLSVEQSRTKHLFAASCLGPGSVQAISKCPKARR